MIVYNMKCGEGHVFEAWFASSAEYESKSAEHALDCPECGDTHVVRGLSAPHVNGGAKAPAPAVGPCGMPCGSTGGMCGMGG